MLSLIVTHNSGEPLADQIVAGIKRQIDDRHLRPGTKLPSIRGFAESYNVSRFTVVEAYDRLVAMGYLRARRGAGFYTAATASHAEAPHPGASDSHKRNEQLVWLIRRLLEAEENTILAGGPWLPNSWLDETGIRQSLNVLARKNGAYLLEYGHPFGYLPLREHLASMLGGIGITVHSEQILLTQGSLRVGFVACAENIANELTDIKMLTSITSSQFTERLVYLMLVDGHYRKYLSRLHERLGEARVDIVRAFERIGLELFAEPKDGMFVWARFPRIDDSLVLAEASQRDGIMLAPGAVFRPHLERSAWMRFNVTVCKDSRVQRWLQRQAAGAAA